jgi:hypothetical protein
MVGDAGEWKGKWKFFYPKLETFCKPAIPIELKTIMSIGQLYNSYHHLSHLINSSRPLWEVGKQILVFPHFTDEKMEAQED